MGRHSPARLHPQATFRQPQSDSTVVKYGSKVIIEHDLTGRSLSSDGEKYTHPNSSQQQRVFCSTNGSDGSLEQSYWIVLPVKQDRLSRAGQAVLLGDRIRLLHFLTKSFLHSHTAHAPPLDTLPSARQEVTCFGLCDDTIDTTDHNDEWIVAHYEQGFQLDRNRAQEAFATYEAQKVPKQEWQIFNLVCLYHPSSKTWLGSQFEDPNIENTLQHQQLYTDKEALNEQHQWKSIFIEAATLDQIPRFLSIHLQSSYPDYFDALHQGPITFGSRIILRHVSTWASLHSHSFHYSHAESSHAQQVTGFTGSHDQNDFWIVLPAEPLMSITIPPGDSVPLGHPFLLKHAATGLFLSSDARYRSPHGGIYQEISCVEMGSIYSLDERFIWIAQAIEPLSEEEIYWKRHFTIQIKHQATNTILHTNFVYFFINDHDRQQEVYGLPASEHEAEGGLGSQSEDDDAQRSSSIQLIMSRFIRDMTASSDGEESEASIEEQPRLVEGRRLIRGSQHPLPSMLLRPIFTRRRSSVEERNNEWKVVYCKPAAVDELPIGIVELLTVTFYEQAPPCY